MTDIFLKLLTFTQIPIVFALFSYFASGLVASSALGRNRDWVLAHPEFNRHRSYRNLWLGFSYLLAASTFVVALNFTAISPIENPADLIRYLLVLPFMVWWVSLIVYCGFIYFGIVRKIPAPARRRTTLASRQLSKLVPPWIIYVGYGLLALIYIAYAVGWATGEVRRETAIAVLFGFSFALVGVPCMLVFITRFRYTEDERPLGNRVRVTGVRIAIGALYFNVFAGAYRILIDFFGITLFSKFGLVAAMWLVLQVIFLGILLHPKIRLMHREYREAYVLGR